MSTSAFAHLTDAVLDAYRREPKTKLSGSRLKAKAIFFEQQFELASDADAGRRFRLYRRHHPDLLEVFSVGLAVCLGDDWLTLCRYNGSYHPHRNQIERNRLVNQFHIHTATERYIRDAERPEGYAEPTERYSSVEGALRCLLVDCNISGILPDGDAHPESLDLDFE